MASKEKNPFNSYVDDKALFHVADYDSESLDMKGIHPTQIFSLLELKDEILLEFKRAQELKKEISSDDTEKTSN